MRSSTPMGLGTLRISCLTLVSLCFVACGKDESGGSDDDDDTPTVTTNTATATATSTNTNTNTNTNGSTGPTTTGSPIGSGGMGGSGGTTGMGGSGGTTGVGGSAGAPGNVGGSAGAGGGEGNVVIEDDCGYEACGGELADTDWSYSRLCVEEDALLAVVQSVCADAELVSASGEVSGTIGFGTDTYDQDTSFSVSAQFEISEACNLLGCTLTGGLLGTVGGFSNGSCIDNDEGGCVCSGTLEGTTEASESDYATDDDNLTLGETESTYCASGDSFKYNGEIQGVEFVYETVPQ